MLIVGVSSAGGGGGGWSGRGTSGFAVFWTDRFESEFQFALRRNTRDHYTPSHNTAQHTTSHSQVIPFAVASECAALRFAASCGSD